MQQSPSLTRVALDTVLDRTRLSAMCGMPVRASRLRIKPDTSIVMGLVSVDAGIPVGWARLLWPDSRGKADKAEHWAGRHALRLSSTETDNGLIFQHGELLTDAKLGAYLVGDSAAITKAQHDDAHPSLQSSPQAGLPQRRRYNCDPHLCPGRPDGHGHSQSHR